jgi:hypothetical protein
MERRDAKTGLEPRDMRYLEGKFDAAAAGSDGWTSQAVLLLHESGGEQSSGRAASAGGIRPYPPCDSARGLLSAAD